ncbi:MAG: hypothetical protein HC860_13850 [Alkalinema sp. RU_4_3]|nr:hypothetical protein [Alkalinema sp. RU_4_3]
MKWCFLAVFLSGTIALPASAQVTIKSTGVVSGTVTTPNKNPTFNQGTTRVDTDAQGRYFRNGELLFDAQVVNPNLVGVDARGRYYVDFRGIPVVSEDGKLVSPALDGGLNAVQRFNNDRPVRLWGNVQDEFVVQGDYQGTAIDPTTGNQYQGTFRIKGQGPRYSDANGGTSPTVFDFKSYYNFKATPQIVPTPTVKSYFVQAMPVKLTITVPAGVTALPPGTVPPGGGSSGGGGVSGGGGTPIAEPPIPSETSIFQVPAQFDPNRLVLQGSPQRPIGPRSRVLLRR